MFWRHRSPRPIDCYLIYARSGPYGNEPLVEVVATEDEALTLEATLQRQRPDLEIQWQPVPWHREQGSATSQRSGERFVHLVLTGMEDDPTGLAAFYDVAAADAMVARHHARYGDAHRRTVVLGQWLSDDYPLKTAE